MRADTLRRDTHSASLRSDYRKQSPSLDESQSRCRWGRVTLWLDLSLDEIRLSRTESESWWVWAWISLFVVISWYPTSPCLDESDSEPPYDSLDKPRFHGTPLPPVWHKNRPDHLPVWQRKNRNLDSRLMHTFTLTWRADLTSFALSSSLLVIISLWSCLFSWRSLRICSSSRCRLCRLEVGIWNLWSNNHWNTESRLHSPTFLCYEHGSDLIKTTWGLLNWEPRNQMLSSEYLVSLLSLHLST